MARIQQIFRAIKTQRRPNCSFLAEKLEVSAKTIQRDIDYMRYQLNLPIEYDEERHGFYLTEEVAHFPSIHITESELVALLVARKEVEQYANTSFQKPLAEAFQKLTAGLVDQISFNWHEFEQTVDIVPIGVSKQNLAIFEIVAAAVRENSELELQYGKLEAKLTELRRVQPYSLICVEHQWYLRAWDLVRHDLRTFHLGRIIRARKLPHHFKRPTGFDVNEALLDSIGVFVGTAPEDIVLKFSGWGSDCCRRTHLAFLPISPNSRRRNRRTQTEGRNQPGIRGPAMVLGRCSGSYVAVMSPVALRAKIRAAHQRAAVRSVSEISR